MYFKNKSKDDPVFNKKNEMMVYMMILNKTHARKKSK